MEKQRQALPRERMRIWNHGYWLGCGGLRHVAIFSRYYVVFHSVVFFVYINDFWETRQSGTATLAVDGSYCGVWRFSSSESDFLHKPVLQFRKRIHRSPASEIVVYSLPLRVFVRQQMPLAAGFILVPPPRCNCLNLMLLSCIMEDKVCFYVAASGRLLICDIRTTLPGRLNRAYW